MSKVYEEHLNSQKNYNTWNLGFVDFTQIVDLFGDYFTFNEINKYDKSTKYIIIVATKLYENNNGIMTIWIDKKFVKDINFKNCGFELIYKLNELIK